MLGLDHFELSPAAARDLCADKPCNLQHYKQRQVEVNTIAAGFGHLGPISAKLHRLANLLPNFLGLFLNFIA